MVNVYGGDDEQEDGVFRSAGLPVLFVGLVVVVVVERRPFWRHKARILAVAGRADGPAPRRPVAGHETSVIHAEFAAPWADQAVSLSEQDYGDRQGDLQQGRYESVSEAALYKRQVRLVEALPVMHKEVHNS